MIQKDKFLHFLAGIFLCLIGGIWLAVAGGFLKEIYDAAHDNHEADIYDFLATVAGGLLVLIIT